MLSHLRLCLRAVVAVVDDEEGSVLVFVGAGLIALMAVFAIGLDVGNWFLHKRAIQNQADAAALAGGAYFANCFVGDGSSAEAAMKAEAGKYDGVTVSPNYNPQIGTGAYKGSLGVAYNSKSYPSGQAENPNDPTPTDVCAPDFVFDVKESNSDVPLIMRGFLPGVPNLAHTSAHARVQLKKEIVSASSLPLAVANVNPNTVTATFVDQATGNALAGCADSCVFQLSKGAPSGTLNMWSGSAAIPAPSAAQKIGVRIGLANVGQGCANTSGGDGYICFDNANTQLGLVTLRGVDSATGTHAAPALTAVWPTTICAGSPFFSDYVLTGGATTCGAGVQAMVDFGTGTTDPTLPASSNGVKAQVFATLNGPNSCTACGTPIPLTYDATTKIWSSAGGAWGVQPGLGTLPITMSWEEHDGTIGSADCSQPHLPNACKGAWSGNAQRLHSASDATAGPVKTVSVTESGATNAGAPYSLGSGTHTLTVTVGLEGNLQLSSSPQLLRVTSGSRTTAVQCDAPGVSSFVAAIKNGCQTPYQLNDWQPADPDPGLCPDPTPPSGAADCVPLQTGNFGNPTSNALDARFSSCPPDYYDNTPPADYDPTKDPRIVQLMITDFSYLSSQGHIPVPVVDFGEFYITGWQGPGGPSSCANNQPWPFSPKVAQSGDIWGYFIKTTVDQPGKGGELPCDPDAITPCVPVMVR